MEQFKRNHQNIWFICWRKDINAIINRIPFLPEESNELNLKTSLIWENIYSSYSRWWKLLPESDKEKGYFRLKIKQRHENIHYHFKNNHWESTDSKFYWNNIIEYLKNEIQEAR